MKKLGLLLFVLLYIGCDNDWENEGGVCMRDSFVHENKDITWRSFCFSNAPKKLCDELNEEARVEITEDFEISYYYIDGFCSDYGYTKGCGFGRYVEEDQDC